MQWVRGSPLIHERIAGRFRDDFMVSGKVAQSFSPESVVVAAAEKFLGGLGGDPGIFSEFSLELSFRPAGVAHEGAHQSAWILGMFDGILGRDPGGKAKAFFRVPPEGRESQVLPGERTADVDVDSGEGSILVLFEELADKVAGGIVEDQAIGALLGTVLGEENNGMVKNTFVQDRVGNEELALKTDLGFLPGMVVGHGGRVARVRRGVKGRGGSRREGDLARIGNGLRAGGRRA